MQNEQPHGARRRRCGDFRISKVGDQVEVSRDGAVLKTFAAKPRAERSALIRREKEGDKPQQ